MEKSPVFSGEVSRHSSANVSRRNIGKCVKVLYSGTALPYHSRPIGLPARPKSTNQEKYFMKTIALTLIAGLGIAASAAAGPASSGKSDKKMVVPPVEPCFRDQELQLDVFANYMHGTHSAVSRDDGFGGGLGLNYFFTRYIGLGVDASANTLFRDKKGNNQHDGVFNSTGSLILRYPLELGSLCLAPYALGGGGVQTGAGSTLGSVHAGAGLEWRATPKLGIYGEGRYTWTTEHNEESTQARIGVRFLF